MLFKVVVDNRRHPNVIRSLVQFQESRLFMSRSFFFFMFILQACNPDTLDVISFEIHNAYHKPIQVKFANYKFRHYPPVDTTFNIPSNEIGYVFFDDGLVLDINRYVVNDSLSFCGDMTVYSDTAESPKSFRSISEWVFEKSMHFKSYTLEIGADDF